MDKKRKEEKTGEGKRYLALILIVVLVFSVYVGRLAQWQLIDGEMYEEISKDQDTQFIRLPTSRGEIIDANGEVLVGNDLTYAVIFNAMTMLENRNPTLLNLIEIFKAAGEEWDDAFPIVVDENGNYIFDEEMESEISYLKSPAMLNLQEYATADDCMIALIKRYDCDGYSTQSKRDLLSIRYSMHKIGFSRTNPYTIARDVSVDTIGIINERLDELPGVETKIIATRNLGEDPALAAHVIGTVGAIPKSTYEKEKEQGNLYSSSNVSGYSLDDKVGVSGIEKAFEKQLRGTYGKQIVTTDSTGVVTSTTVTEPPKAGNTIQLTLRSDLQKVANDSLRENVLSNTLSPKGISGSAVVMDIKDGGILAAANYPSYDLDRYYTDKEYYTMLVEDETNKPLLNRAFFGEYTPGSVFKPMVSIAALEEQVINSGTSFVCEGKLEYADQVFGCLGTHGGETVAGALRDSCNVFFYRTGLLLGIEKMDAYAEYFGLGEKSGVEIGEGTGTMSSKQKYLEIQGTPWTTGNDAQTAIGQLDSVFTPLQLANYTATIANNGKRYKAHLLDKVIDYNTGEIIEEYEPVVVKDAEISESTMSIVKSGMRDAARHGTARTVFGDYPIAVYAKTGTAETRKNQAAHLTFIAFAPAENPEIAVAVVMEYGNKGMYAANVAKDLFNAYFDIEPQEETDETENSTGEGGSLEDNGEFGDYTQDDESDDVTDSEPSVDPEEIKRQEREVRNEYVYNNPSEVSIGAFYNPDKDIIIPPNLKEGEEELQSDTPVG